MEFTLRGHKAPKPARPKVERKPVERKPVGLHRPFGARFDGTCGWCSLGFESGDSIVRTSTHNWVHEKCARGRKLRG